MSTRVRKTIEREALIAALRERRVEMENLLKWPNGTPYDQGRMDEAATVETFVRAFGS
jgi:hypothetical protein